MIFEHKNLACSNFILEQDAIPDAFDGFRMVCITDLHNNCYGKKNKKLQKRIHQMKPDIILIAGDMITASALHKSYIAMELLEDLSKKYPIYFSPGNHEYKWEVYEKYKNKTKEMTQIQSQEKVTKQDRKSEHTFCSFLEHLKTNGITYLDNQSIILSKEGETLQITGLNLPLDYFKKGGKPVSLSQEELQKFIGTSNKNGYQILLAHMPIYFSVYALWGADFVLSGHVHGGVMRLPFLGGVISPQYEIFPKFDAGMYQKNHSNMVVSRGLGTHTIPIRIFNRPELICVVLKK